MSALFYIGGGGGDNSPYTVLAHVIPLWTEEMWNNRMRSKRKVLTWWFLLLLLVEWSLLIILACFSLRNNGSARLIWFSWRVITNSYLLYLKGSLLYFISGFYSPKFYVHSIFILVEVNLYLYLVLFMYMVIVIAFISFLLKVLTDFCAFNIKVFWNNTFVLIFYI